MSKLNLIREFKKKNPKLSHTELEIVIKVFLKSIINALRNGKALEIRNFGRWYCKRLKENYNARNPATNELIYKPERVRVRFKVSKNLKKIINE